MRNTTRLATEKSLVPFLSNANHFNAVYNSHIVSLLKPNGDYVVDYYNY